MLSKSIYCVATAAFLLLGTALTTARAADDAVVATVNGFQIHASDVDNARKSLPPEAQSYPENVIHDYLVNTLVNNHLVAEEARKQGLAKDPDVRKQVAQIEDHVLEQVYLERRVEKDVTPDKLQTTYQEMLKSTPPEEEVHARHILVKSEAEAMDALARLRKGEDFATVAKQVSTDGSAQAGGDLGYFTRERMVKPFSDAAFALKPGTYTDTPVRTQFGWHLIKVEDHRTKNPPTFEEAQQDIQAETRRALAESDVAELRNKAKIDIVGADKPAAKAAPAAKSDAKKKQ